MLPRSLRPLIFVMIVFCVVSTSPAAETKPALKSPLSPAESLQHFVLDALEVEFVLEVLLGEAEMGDSPLQRGQVRLQLFHAVRADLLF